MNRICRLALSVSFLFTSLAIGADWPCWRGAGRDGISHETNWNPDALLPEARILWSGQVGLGHSGLVIKDGRLFTVGYAEPAAGVKKGVETVWCLDAVSGFEVWRYSYPAFHSLKGYPGPAATPAVDGEALFMIEPGGRMFCLDLTSGRLVWEKDLVQEMLAEKAGSEGYCGSPLIIDDLVVVNVNTAGMALNRKTGDLMWTSRKGKHGFSSPFLARIGGRELVLINGTRKLYGLDPVTGKERWSLVSRTFTDPVCVSTNMVLLSYEGWKAFRLDEDRPSEIWSRAERGLSNFQNMVTVGGHIFSFGLGEESQGLYCVNGENGEILWKQNFQRFGAITAVNNHLLILNGDGALFVVEGSPGGYREIARATVLTMKDSEGQPLSRQYGCWIAPVLSNGLIYMRNSYGEMACVDVRR